VGSLKLDGILFVVYSNDHPPRHVHGFLDGTEVILDLLTDENIALAQRKDSARQRKALRCEENSERGGCSL